MRARFTVCGMVLALSAGPAAPARGQSRGDVLCFLPEARRREIAAELSVEWAARGFRLVPRETPAPRSVEDAVALARANGAAGVLVIELPEGSPEPQLRFVSRGGTRWRQRTLAESYSLVDARALAIASTRLLAAAPSSGVAPDDQAWPPAPSVSASPEEASPLSPEAPAGAEPPEAPEAPERPPPSRSEAETATPWGYFGFSFAVGLGFDWMDVTGAHGQAMGGWPLGGDVRFHTADGHGVVLSYLHLPGFATGDYVDARYSHRFGSRDLSKELGWSVMLDAGATVNAATYKGYCPLFLPCPPTERVGLGLVVAATGALHTHFVSLGLELAYRATVNPWGLHVSGSTASYVTVQNSVTATLRLGILFGV